MILLTAAWVMSTAPFAAPDEGAHYLRAVSIANGVLAGHREPFAGLYWPKQESEYVAHDNRAVTVPARLSPSNARCLNGKPNLAGSCTEASYTGDYPPLPYLLPALAVKISGKVNTAMWLSRALSALANLGFVLLAVALVVCGTSGSLPLLGLLAAVTPMVFFVGSVISPNGLEIAANLAFVAGLLRLVGEPRVARRWVLAATAISGVVVVLAWSLGPLIVAVDFFVAALLVSRERLTLLLTHHRRGMFANAVALILSGIVFLIYGKASGLLHATLQLNGILNALWIGRYQLNPVLHDAVGVFGALSIRLPTPMYWLWWGLIVALCGAAAMWSGRRGRVAMPITFLVVLAFPVLFWAFYFRQVTGLQGRYVLPVLILAPMVAGHLLGVREQAGAIPGRVHRTMVAGVVALMAILQVGAWWFDARAYAGRDSSHWFLNHPLWSPPLGWLVCMVLVGLGTASVLAIAGAELVRGPRSFRGAELEGGAGGLNVANAHPAKRT